MSRTQLEEDTRDAHFDTSIGNVYELVTRVDERVRAIMKKQEEMEHKMEAPLLLANAINNRVSVLESKDNSKEIKELENKADREFRALEVRIQALEGSSSISMKRWSTIIDFGIKLFWVVLAAYVLYRLHLTPPP